jgi:hypothetical protein
MGKERFARCEISWVPRACRPEDLVFHTILERVQPSLSIHAAALACSLSIYDMIYDWLLKRSKRVLSENIKSRSHNLVGDLS